MPPLPPSATILQVLPRLDSGGVERGTLEIAQALAAAGALPVVASQGGRLVSQLERVGARHIVLPLARKSPATIWRNTGRLERLIAAQGIDLVHARSRAPAWSAARAARRTGTPFLTTYHAPYAENLPGKRWYNSVMASGDRVIAISRYIANLIVERHAIDPARIRVIPRGVDPALFDPVRIAPDRIARLVRAWRLPDDAPVIMLPARLSRWKGQAVLIKAMAALQNRTAICVLLGEGRPAYAQELAQLAHHLGVADRLRLAGHCDDVPAALMLATVAVSASTQPEGFGRAVIEAQAMGCAVIATNHGGAAETVDDLVTGWQIPPNDPATLATLLDHALAMTPEDRLALGERARASVLAHYSTARMQQATLDVYAELLEPAGAGAPRPGTV